jgi:RES domain-containing protein
MVSTVKNELVIFRVTLTEFISDLSGKGAKREGGRWNAPGTPVLYTSQNISLAILESSSILPKKYWKDKFSYITVTIPTSVKIKTVLIKNLKRGWRDHPFSAQTREIGKEWIKLGVPILKVPATVVPDENNYIINPEAIDFNKIVISKPKILNIQLKE